MNIGQFFSVLRARWYIALLVFLLTVGAAVGLSMLMVKQYIATATLVVDQTRPDPVTGAAFSGNPSAAFTATQIDVLKSPRVAQQVIANLHLLDDPVIKALWQEQTQGVGSMETWLSERLLLSMEARPSRESNIVSVSYKATDAAQAAQYANAFVQAYMDVSLKMKVGPAGGARVFFEKRAKELRAALQDAQAKVSAYQRDKGVVISTDGQLDVESARLNELSSQLVALQAVAAGSNGRESAVRGGGGEVSDLINNPAIISLRGDMTRAEARLQELSSRLGDNHPQVIEARATINSLRGRLDAEMRRANGSVVQMGSVNRAREAEIRAALEQQRIRVLKMRTARDEGMVLVRDVDNAQKAYDSVVARLNQVGQEGQLTQDQGNGYVLAEAVAPLEPSSPKVVRNVALAGVLGLLLGIAAVMMLELTDRRVRTVEEISAVLGLPIFGVLPKPGGLGGLPGGGALALSPRGLFGALPAPRKDA